MEENRYKKYEHVQEPKNLICQITIDSLGLIVDNALAKSSLNPSREPPSKWLSKPLLTVVWTDTQIC